MVTHDQSEVLDSLIYTGVKSGYFRDVNVIKAAFAKYGLSDAIEESIDRLKESAAINVDKKGNMKQCSPNLNRT